MNKLYLITRQDLSPAQQAVQATHAARQFHHEYPEIDQKWFETSNTLAFLSVPNEQALGVLLEKAASRGIPVAAFHEPDRDNELTAIAIGPRGKKITQGLPLALQHHGSPEKDQSSHDGGRC